MSKTLQAIFVGCGGFSKNYLPAYTALDFARPVLCIDKDEAAAKAMADRFPGAKFSTDFEQAVKTPADLAVVSTPNFMHVEQASALLQAGKHVLLQKPMARTLEESRQLMTAYGKTPGKKLGLYMSMLDYGMWWEIREAVANQRVFGDVCQISMRLGHTGGLLWNSQPANLWRFSKESTGGGAFIMLGVHFIHFSRWLLGLRITRVNAQTKNLHCTRVEGEDICQFQGELSNGGLVQLSVAWNSQGEHVAVYGTEGSMVYLDNELLRLRGSKPWKTSYFSYDTPNAWATYPKLTPPAFDDGKNPYNQQRQFAEAIRDNRDPAVEAREGFWDMQVVDAVYRSAETNSWQDVKYE